MLIDGFNESPIHTVATVPIQCMTTANSIIHTQLSEKNLTPTTRIARNNSNSQTNSALAMSQLGTVYATKRRRRNGKRLVHFFNINISTEVDKSIKFCDNLNQFISF